MEAIGVGIQDTTADLRQAFDSANVSRAEDSLNILATLYEQRADAAKAAFEGAADGGLFFRIRDLELEREERRRALIEETGSARVTTTVSQAEADFARRVDALEASPADSGIEAAVDGRAASACALWVVRRTDDPEILPFVESFLNDPIFCYADN